MRIGYHPDTLEIAIQRNMRDILKTAEARAVDEVKCIVGEWQRLHLEYAKSF